MDESQQHAMCIHKTIYILHESTDITTLEKANLYQQKADGWLPGAGVGECRD